MSTQLTANGLTWTSERTDDPRVLLSALGYLPMFLHADDERPAREQFNERYVYGGWHKFEGHTYHPDTQQLSYPGDPPQHPVAQVQLRDETIILYPYAWVLILQKDGTYEIARLD